MNNNWSESEARSIIDQSTEAGVPLDMALRVYSTRLLGQDPQLVLHGGGNTSMKTSATDVLGDEVDVLCVKGSGWDMAVIEAAGLPAVRLDPLRRLRDLDELSDEDMVNFLRANLLDSSAPNPSVETLLHAFLPHKFVDHTHANAILSLTNQPDGESICRDVYGDRIGIVPYIMPGFDLAQEAVKVFEAQPGVQGLIALNHGIFTFAETAHEAYERMIEMVTQAEEHLSKGRNRVFSQSTFPGNPIPTSEVAAIVRGACAIRDDASNEVRKRFVLDFRAGPATLSYVNGKELDRYSQVGVATPDHIIRTKGWPLVLQYPSREKSDAFKNDTINAISTFVDRYHSYFERNNARQADTKIELDPIPRVILVPGVGLFGVGASHKDAAIASDIAEATIQTITDAEAIGTYQSIGESDMFDLEYWSLEQAKLGRGGEQPLAGHVTVVTGGGGTIGSAIARAFSNAGSEVAILDVDADLAQRAADGVGGSAIAVDCDVTDGDSVRAAFDRICKAFGGVDIVVSNAGAAWQGKIGEVSDSLLRKSFELNFFAHQRVAQNAVRVMRHQRMGGALLFNVSKQAVNPGLDFGPYGLPKAATLSLVRQYALDHGSEGIRANAVNADRIRSGLLTQEMVASRAVARGVTESDYMSGNLLGREVTADDVAQAFVHSALGEKTTANVTTVDGGNISAILR